MLELITSDLFCIASRLRQIDANYHLFYDTVRESWEVHSSQVPSLFSMQFRVPFEELDERTVEHAWITRVENSNDLEDGIEKHNEMLEQSAKREMEKQIDKLADMFDFAYSTSQEIEFNKTSKWY